MKNVFFSKQRVRPGISLLFAMTIVSVGFLIMVGSVNLAIATMKNTRATGYRLDAYYGALSGLEQAGWTVAEQTENGVTGYQTGGTLNTSTDWDGPVMLDFNNDGDTKDPGESTTYYYIAGQSEILDGSSELYNPMPGTGTAGTNCSVFTPPTDEDDPCAWNKLEVGDTASIPLYYSANGETIINPADHSTDWSTFELYIRTPCGWDGTTCTTDGTAGTGSNILVNWEVIADCNGVTNGCYLIPKKSSSSNNSKIYESLINNSNPVLDATSNNQGIDQNTTPKTIKDFIVQSTISKPVLNFSIVDTLNGASYLEYQLRTANTNTYSANANITLVATAVGGPQENFEQTLTRTLGRSTNVIQFVLD